MIADLKDKVVLVTGGSTGIGAAAAKAFAANGAQVMVHYNASKSEAEAVCAAIIAEGGEAALCHGDVIDKTVPARIVSETVQRFGRLDILINNAGGMLGRKMLPDITDEHYDRVLDLNIRSVIKFMQAAADVMKTQGSGNIINVSSIAARNGGGGGAVLYASTKAFVSAFTKGMAKELIGSHIRVNAVSPGTIATPFHERYSNAQQIEAMRQTIPLGRLGVAEECAGTFLYLASDSLSGYVTGQVIEVNGGQLMP